MRISWYALMLKNPIFISYFTLLQEALLKTIFNLAKEMYTKTNDLRKVKKHKENMFFFTLGHIFWNYRHLMVFFLCICQLLCSSGSLTHCGSLIRSMLLFSAMQQPVKHHRHSYTLRNSNSLCANTWVLSLTVGFSQSANDPGIKGRKQRTQKANGNFFFLGKMSK